MHTSMHIQIYSNICEEITAVVFNRVVHEAAQSRILDQLIEISSDSHDS